MKVRALSVALLCLNAANASAQPLGSFACTEEGQPETFTIDLSGDLGAVQGQSEVLISSPGQDTLQLNGSFVRSAMLHTRVPQDSLTVHAEADPEETSNSLKAVIQLSSIGTIEAYVGSIIFTQSGSRTFEKHDVSCEAKAPPEVAANPPHHCGRCAF